MRASHSARSKLASRLSNGNKSIVEPSRGRRPMNRSTWLCKRPKFAICAMSKVGRISALLLFHWYPSVTNMPLPKKPFPSSYRMGCKPNFSKWVDSTTFDTSGSHVLMKTLPARFVLYVFPYSLKRQVAVSRKFWFCADLRLISSRSGSGCGGSRQPCLRASKRPASQPLRFG